MAIGKRPSQEGLHALRQRDLIVGELEVHRYSLGRPRMRSAMMLRWIWLVPAAIVNDVLRTRSSTKLPDGQSPTSSSDRLPRSSTRMATSVIRWNSSE